MKRALYDSKSDSIPSCGIDELLSDQGKISSWCEVEAALARAQAMNGLIPKSAAEDIAMHARIECLDLDEMDRIRDKVGHGFVPFVKVLVAACTGDGKKYVHYGVTTQNVQQTAQLLTAKRVEAVLKTWIMQILDNLAALADAEADSVMPGRTHGRHAVPITYGYKAAVWIYELRQALERLEQSEGRIFSVMMGGAVGAFNATGPVGRKIQDDVADLLGMSSMEVPSRMIATHKIEYVMDLSLVCQVLHKMAEEVYYCGMEEFDEVHEGFQPGTIGSSTMPQKINPKLAKGIIANSEKLYSLIGLGLYSNARMFEGDSSAYMQTDVLLEEAQQLACEALKRSEELTRTLTVNRSKLRSNASIDGGLTNSEYIMMELASRIGKDAAHQLIYKLATKAESECIPFKEVLLQDSDVTKHFTFDQIEHILDPAGYTGCSADIAHEQAELVRKTHEA